MALPDTYSELYPGRFLKSDLLKGHKITLTIADVDVQELTGETGKPAAKVIVTFQRPQAEAWAKIPLELVLPKTNGECLRRMFGNKPAGWRGKPVTIFPSTTKFGRDTVDCIRIWGSPELAEDMPISVPQGRKKPLEMVMHAVKQPKAAAPAPTPASPATTTEPRIIAAFEILDWNSDERAAYLAEMGKFTTAQILADLNAKIDARDAAQL